MRSRLVVLVGVSLITAVFMSAPTHLHGQPPPQPQHEQHHPGAPEQPELATAPHANMMQMMATMRANDAKLDELVKHMNAAHGAAKVDAMAELLTTLVQDRRAMHDSMSDMSTMMDMMGTMHGGSNTAMPHKP
jgi:hypothetical protein